MTGRLDGRVALITGASRGIGAAVAKRFAAEGAHVILVARTAGGLEETDDAIRAAGHSPATLVPLDLARPDSADQLAASVYQRFEGLDILVGNAAVLGVLSPVGHLDPKTWDSVFAVNVTANWRLIRGFDPLLRRAEHGRAIFVTAGAARSAPAFWGAYAASKAALEALVQTYAREVERTEVRVNLIDPGVVGTRLRATAFPGEDPATLPAPETVAEDFVALAAPDCARHGELVVVQPAARS